MKAFFRDIRSSKRKAAIADLKSIVHREIDKTLEEVKRALVKSHELVVADWTSDVGFAAKKMVNPSRITVYVYPTGEDKLIWIYVDQGTDPHPIPKNPLPPGKYLWFQWGGKGSYVPKTLARPARTVSGGGYVQGGHLVRMKQVNHPGNEGRHFSEQIAKDIEPDFKRLVENAFVRTARQVSE